MKISKGTIVRTIVLAMVLLNLLLKALGKPVIDFNEGSILYWLEFAIEIAVIIVTFWKNNSFSPAAIKADEFLKELRADGDYYENEPGIETEIESEAE
jgi:SPP1 family holin